MVRIIHALRMGAGVDEELLRTAPMEALKHYVRSLSFRLYRVEAILASYVGYDVFLR